MRILPRHDTGRKKKKGWDPGTDQNFSRDGNAHLKTQK
jgi:hypothetical protein